MAKAKNRPEAELEDDEDVGILEYSEDIGEAEAPEPLPERDYPATITATELRATQDGRPMVRVQWRINEEDYPADYDAGNAPGGKTISQFIMADDTPATRHRLRRFLEAIGAPTGKSLRPKEWLNLSAQVSIKHEDYEGTAREKISKVEPA